MRRFLTAVCGCAFFLTMPSIAQNYWSHIGGPTGGSVAAAAIDADQRLFAGVVSGGIYRSVNDGDSWELVLADQEARSPADIVVTPSGVVIAASLWFGVHRSTDHGNSWLKPEMDLPHGDFHNTGPTYNLAVHPDGDVFAATAQGPYRSSDDGNTWHVVDNLPSNIYALSVASDGGILAGASGMYRSRDGGATWTRIDNEIESEGIIWVEHIDSEHALARTSERALFRTTDAGVSWEQVANALADREINMAVIHPNGIIYARTDDDELFFSPDFGDSWFPASGALTSIEFRTMLADQTGRTFLASTSGMYRSPDGNGDWHTINNGIVNSIIRSLLHFDEDRLLAETLRDGLQYSSDNGASWRPVEGDIAAADVQSFAAGKNDRVFAGSREHGMFLSDDNGITWLPLENELKDLSISTLLVTQDESMFAGTDSGLYRSPDYGLTWRQLTEGFTDNFVEKIVANADGTLFVATSDVKLNGEGGVFRSTDGGDTWLLRSIGLKSHVNATRVLDITTHANGGLYAVEASRGIFRSTNNGNSWVNINANLPENTFLAAVEVNRLGEIFIGDRNKGVFRSTDDGDSWHELTDGLWGRRIRDLTVGAQGRMLASTEDFGVFSGQPTITDVEYGSLTATAGFTLDRIAPNPIAASAIIGITLHRPAKTTVRVYNQISQPVATLISETLQPGMYEFSWPAQALPAGVYYCELRCNEFVQTRICTIVR